MDAAAAAAQTVIPLEPEDVRLLVTELTATVLPALERPIRDRAAVAEDFLLVAELAVQVAAESLLLQNNNSTRNLRCLKNCAT
jgi:hypothetical protein